MSHFLMCCVLIGAGIVSGMYLIEVAIAVIVARYLFADLLQAKINLIIAARQYGETQMIKNPINMTAVKPNEFPIAIASNMFTTAYSLPVERAPLSVEVIVSELGFRWVIQRQLYWKHQIAVTNFKLITSLTTHPSILNILSILAVPGQLQILCWSALVAPLVYTIL
ncbi:hypothetical protein [Beijerinckia indica]|uniref:Uncharacterized protein n=1 Tax=Beijerinckia indica subsp. indica (strain ATCC 9039 / DSM 1715 / NCIMB 8712) TaxID=395963 RepID=B2IIX4_BEII9|nr:hypothetical protein [Beijerinckia indica]ACB96186.1 hypothetical protein Bind_2591 [Beijerinckia indica subsp. indica ATCC 9039]